MNITNYCACTYDTPPKYNQFDQKNIICNSWTLSSSQKSKLQSSKILFDSDGYNISHLNYTFAELTASFYIWKNIQEEIISFTHYRRFWNESEISDIDFKTTICVPNKGHLGKSAYDQFVQIHGSQGINFAESLLNDNFILKKEHFSQLKNIDFVYPANLIICNKKIYDKICEIQFEFLLELYKSYLLQICQKDNYQRRFIGFLSERTLTVILENSDYYLGDINKKTCSFFIM